MLHPILAQLRDCGAVLLLIDQRLNARGIVNEEPSLQNCEWGGDGADSVYVALRHSACHGGLQFSWDCGVDVVQDGSYVVWVDVMLGQLEGAGEDVADSFRLGFQAGNGWFVEHDMEDDPPPEAFRALIAEFPAKDISEQEMNTVLNAMIAQFLRAE